MKRCLLSLINRRLCPISWVYRGMNEGFLPCILRVKGVGGLLVGSGWSTLFSVLDVVSRGRM